MDASRTSWYNQEIEKRRQDEFPMLQDTLYLDHAGTAIPSKSLMQQFAIDMSTNLYGNPHSTSSAAQATSKKIENIRLQLLDFFKADSDHFDLIFVANATAGIKLVAEAFREAENGFWFGYHHTAHTSVVGVRELADTHQCFKSDEETEKWFTSTTPCTSSSQLFAYPAQSNMNGTRLPLTWCREIRQHQGGHVYTLLDAAALASTSPLDLSDLESSPDFTVISLYKIFGFPDLGGLIVRKDAGQVFANRRYFGGGTVDMVACSEDRWFARKHGPLHEQLEDGSLPIHNIISVQSAMDTYHNLFGSLEQVSRHCAFLAHRLYKGLSELRHSNRRSVCYMYVDGARDFYNLRRQGPVLAFNICDGHGSWVGTTEVEKLASIKNIQLRTGSLCNPGGVAAALNLSVDDIKENYTNGQRCGSEHDIMRGQPTSMIRVSIGPVNTIADIDAFISFIDEFFVETVATSENGDEVQLFEQGMEAPFSVESLMVFPIKSCAGWKIPAGKRWRVYQEGLAWDREWCVILAGSGSVMSQKRYPKMALIRPEIDLKEGLLRVSFADSSANVARILISLHMGPSLPVEPGQGWREASVCGDNISAHAYSNPEVNAFFTQALGVKCHLGRFPSGGSQASSRHAKTHLQPSRFSSSGRNPGGSLGVERTESNKIPILLSNESPVLTISSSSLNRLNEQIKSSGGKAVRAEAFRANVVVGETKSQRLGPEQPYAEDNWRMIRIANQYFEFLGPCRRCQMVCIDQDTGERSGEPFTTLAKTRRIDGKIFFGQHCAHVPSSVAKPSAGSIAHTIATIATGDPVYPIL